jgi:hypothetical protein
VWRIVIFRSVLVGANGLGITANSSPFDRNSNTWTGQDNEVIRAGGPPPAFYFEKKKKKKNI